MTGRKNRKLIAALLTGVLVLMLTAQTFASAANAYIVEDDLALDIKREPFDADRDGIITLEDIFRTADTIGVRLPLMMYDPMHTKAVSHNIGASKNVCCMDYQFKPGISKETMLTVMESYERAAKETQTHYYDDFIMVCERKGVEDPDSLELIYRFMDESGTLIMALYLTESGAYKIPDEKLRQFEKITPVSKVEWY